MEAAAWKERADALLQELSALREDAARRAAAAAAAPGARAGLQQARPPSWAACCAAKGAPGPLPRCGATLTPLCFPEDATGGEAVDAAGAARVLVVGGELPGERWFGDAALLSLGPRGDGDVAWGALSGELLPPLAGHAAAYVGNGAAVVFGGFDGSSDRSDSWLLHVADSPTEGEGEQALTASELQLATRARPSARSQHSLVSLRSVPAARYTLLGEELSASLPAVGAQCVLFGGYASGDGLAGDLWVLDLSARRWLRPQTRGDAPLARCGHAAVMMPAVTGSDAGDSLMLVHGGFDGRACLSDLHAYEVATATWTQLQAVGAAPMARRGHAMGISGDGVLLYGGFAPDHDAPLLDLHVLRRTTALWQWQLVELAAPPEGAVSPGASCTVLGDRLLLWGGAGADGGRNDSASSPPPPLCVLEDASRAELRAAAAAVCVAEQAKADAIAAQLERAKLEHALAGKIGAEEALKEQLEAAQSTTEGLHTECAVLRATADEQCARAERAESSGAGARAEADATVADARADAEAERAAVARARREAEAAITDARERVADARAVEAAAALSVSDAKATAENAQAQAREDVAAMAHARTLALARAEAADKARETAMQSEASAHSRASRAEGEAVEALRRAATAEAELSVVAKQLATAEAQLEREAADAAAAGESTAIEARGAALSREANAKLSEQLGAKEVELAAAREKLDSVDCVHAEAISSLKREFAAERQAFAAERRDFAEKLRERKDADLSSRLDEAEAALKASRAMERAALAELHAVQARLLEVERREAVGEPRVDRAAANAPTPSPLASIGLGAGGEMLVF